MTKDLKKINKKKATIINKKLSRQRCREPDPVLKKINPDPACSERMHPDPVCPEVLDPDPDPVCPEKLVPDPD